MKKPPIVLALFAACNRSPDICPPGERWFICTVTFSPPCGCGVPYTKSGLEFCASSQTALNNIIAKASPSATGINCIDTGSNSFNAVKIDAPIVEEDGSPRVSPQCDPTCLSDAGSGGSPTSTCSTDYCVQNSDCCSGQCSLNYCAQ